MIDACMVRSSYSFDFHFAWPVYYYAHTWKKQLSKLSFFEYIVGITVGDIAGTMSMDLGISLQEGITSILIWSLFPVLIARLSLRNKNFVILSKEIPLCLSKMEKY